MLDTADLRDRYEERAAICEFDGGQDRPRAEARAWREVASIWHRQHGRRTSSDLCAGCGKPLGTEADVLFLAHGERAHSDDGYACIAPMAGDGSAPLLQSRPTASPSQAASVNPSIASITALKP